MLPPPPQVQGLGSAGHSDVWSAGRRVEILTSPLRQIILSRRESNPETKTGRLIALTAPEEEDGRTRREYPRK